VLQSARGKLLAGPLNDVLLLTRAVVVEQLVLSDIKVARAAKFKHGVVANSEAVADRGLRTGATLSVPRAGCQQGPAPAQLQGRASFAQSTRATNTSGCGGGTAWKNTATRS
jgi:hypothetical protein